MSKCKKCGEQVERVTYHRYNTRTQPKALCKPCHRDQHRIFVGPCEWLDTPSPSEVKVKIVCPDCGGSGLRFEAPTKEHPHGLAHRCTHPRGARVLDKASYRGDLSTGREAEGLGNDGQGAVPDLPRGEEGPAPFPLRRPSILGRVGGGIPEGKD